MKLFNFENNYIYIRYATCKKSSYNQKEHKSSNKNFTKRGYLLIQHTCIFIIRIFTDLYTIFQESKIVSDVEEMHLQYITRI